MILKDASGRIRTSMLIMVSLALVVGVVYVHQAASAWSDTAAARAAVTAILGAIEQAEPPVAAEPTEGREATEQEAAEIDKAVHAYLKALQEADFEAAWELIHPETRSDLDFEVWQQEQMESADTEQGNLEELDAIQLMMLGDDFELGEVITQPEGGWARIVMTLEVPGTLLMRRTEAGWTLDLAGTRDSEARLVLERQLKAFTRANESELGALSALIAQETEYVPISVSRLFRLPMAEVSYEIAGRRITGEAAIVSTEARARVHVAMPLAYGERGWSIAWCREPRVIEADARLADAVEGRTVSSAPRGAQQACQSNLKQLALAALMYASDYDERFPIADRWSWALHPYCRNVAIHHCPSDEEPYSYAVNYKLSRQPMSKVTYPGTTVLLFESDLGLPNAWDDEEYPGTSLCDPPRHNEGNNYAFVDGHVMWCRRDNPAIGQDAYRLVPLTPPAGGPPQGEAMVEPPEEEMAATEAVSEGPPAPPQALGLDP